MPERELGRMAAYLRATGFLRSRAVEAAMLKVDRGLFVPEGERPFAYDDCALPVGHGQTISAPSVVAFMLERLEIGPGMKILEVGTGSGYNSALLAELVGPKGKVISVDIIPELAELAKSNIAKIKNYKNLEICAGDASCGWPERAPYDRIIVTAAMPSFDASHPLGKQLTGNGKLIAPVGPAFGQDLVLFDKKTGRGEPVLPVMFVPLVGKCGFQGEELL